MPWTKRSSTTEANSPPWPPGPCSAVGWSRNFRSAALEQLADFKGPALASGGSIRDLTDRDWFSIDNDDSRDLDQLSLSEPLPQGGLRVWVAVADVDALVKKGSPIDQHAQLNTTSVYTSARIFSMLPERLSTDLTSLNQDEDRLAIVTEMAFSDDGVLVEVGHLPGPGAQQGAAGLRRGVGLDRRRRRDLPEAGPTRCTGWPPNCGPRTAWRRSCGCCGAPKDRWSSRPFSPMRSSMGSASPTSVNSHRTAARQLIEELMIATNGCTARYPGRPWRRGLAACGAFARTLAAHCGHGAQLRHRTARAA